MAKTKRNHLEKRTFVLDSSATLVWAFEDEEDTYAEAVADYLPKAQAVVTAMWPLEVANALLMGERRKRISETKVAQFLALLTTLPIEVDQETSGRAWHNTLSLARLHKLTAYDASYLEVAVRRGLPLASLDDRLKAAADAAGVAAFRPGD